MPVYRVESAARRWTSSVPWRRSIEGGALAKRLRGEGVMSGRTGRQRDSEGRISTVSCCAGIGGPVTLESLICPGSLARKIEGSARS